MSSPWLHSRVYLTRFTEILDNRNLNTRKLICVIFRVIVWHQFMSNHLMVWLDFRFLEGTHLVVVYSRLNSSCKSRWALDVLGSFFSCASPCETFLCAIAIGAAFWLSNPLPVRLCYADSVPTPPPLWTISCLAHLVVRSRNTFLIALVNGCLFHVRELLPILSL